jgi:hypothetical protein
MAGATEIFLLTFTSLPFECIGDGFKPTVSITRSVSDVIDELSEFLDLKFSPSSKSIFHSSSALRNLFLVAGPHYGYTVGRFDDFEQTFLYHKFEMLKQLNDWSCARQDSGIVANIGHIATMCLVEVRAYMI